MILARKINKIPEIYVMFVGKLPEFYVTFARKIFLPKFGGTPPHLLRLG